VAKGADGNLRLVGRLKEMFKSGGYNVYPTEIETVIGSHPAVGAVAVVEAPDKLWAEVGLAFVVPKSGGTLTAAELSEYCRARLANYKVPKRFEIVVNLPQLSNGKFDKVELRERARRLAGDGTTQHA
jgi:acyl-CoA synthetase (AMP-forming)/AMP-acid ligase II